MVFGEPLVVLLVLALLLGPGLILFQRRNQRRTTRRGFDHSLARSSLPELHFRKPEVRDVDQIAALAREPQTMAANRWRLEDADKHEAFLRSDRFESFALVSLVAELATNEPGEPSEIVGVGSLDLRPETTEPSIGVHIAAAHAGRGFGTELMSAMISLTQLVSPGSVWVGTAVDNDAMQQVMAKLGYEPGDGTTVFRGTDGSIVSSLWYQVGTNPF